MPPGTIHDRILAKSEELEYLWSESDRKGYMSAADQVRVDELNSQLLDLERQQQDQPINGLRFPGGGGVGARGSGGPSPGQTYVESPEFKGWLRGLGGAVSDRQRVGNGPVLQFKSLITSVAMQPLIPADDRGFVGFQWPAINILGLFTQSTTTSDVVEYAVETERENNAAPVPEATDVSGTSGTKPMSTFSLERAAQNVRTIAHWIPATKRALSDAAQLRQLIDAFLREGLRQATVAQVISGDGTGENLTGLLNTQGLLTQAFDSDLLVTSRRAKTRVSVDGLAAPTAYVLNPLDVEALDLTRMQDGSFYWGGPISAMQPARLWSLPVIEEPALPQGTGLVGDWRQCVVYWREQATLSVTDSHADFFVRNLVAILGEHRLAFAVLRPSAVCSFATEAAAAPPGGGGA